MASRTRVRAFKCAGCDYLTQNEDDLAFRAKVNVIPESGVTFKAHTPRCLVTAVAQELGVIITTMTDAPGLDTPLPDDQALEQYETAETPQ